MMFFFFNDTATTEIYTLSLHDALPIFAQRVRLPGRLDLDDLGAHVAEQPAGERAGEQHPELDDAYPRERARASRVADRKSTRLNSSHANISYAVFCLKKKKTTNKTTRD